MKNIMINGIKLFNSSVKKNIFGWKKYKGNAEEICLQIIKDCWNGKYFQTSLGHFDDFWVRDFSWCCSSLLKLGFKEEVRKTLLFALNHYQKNNKITSVVSKKGKCFDFPAFSVDSLPCFFHSILLTEKSLIEENSDFFNEQIEDYFNKVINKNTGLVKNAHFSSIRDHYVRNSCCYDNCMVGMLAEDLKKTRLYNPFRKFNYKKLILKNFWKENYFVEQVNSERTSGDSLVFPFWTGLFNSKEMFNQCVKKIKELKLDEPFPLKYSDNNKGKKVLARIFAPNYEGTTVWAHIGIIYLQLLKKHDLKEFKLQKEKYAKIIEQNKNFLEVFNPDGTPYKSIFYHSDEGMLWASMFLV